MNSHRFACAVAFVLLIVVPRLCAEMEVGATRLDRQQAWSMGKSLAISADGVIHLGYTQLVGGGPHHYKSAVGLCIDGDIASNVVRILATESEFRGMSYLRAGESGFSIGSSIPALITSYNRNPWVSVDFDGCTLAYSPLMVQHRGIDMYRHAVDELDMCHMLVHEADTEDHGLYYYCADASICCFVEDSCQVSESAGPGLCVTSADSMRAIALLWSEFSGDTSIVPELPEEWSQVLRFYDIRNAEGSLAPSIAGMEPIELVTSNAGWLGADLLELLFLGGDFDAVYDVQEDPDLHVAWVTGMFHTDSLFMGAFGSDEMVLCNSRFRSNYGSILWHMCPDWDAPVPIAIGLTTTREQDQIPCPGLNRMALDRVQIAVDQDTGHLFAAWNQYTAGDTRAPGEDGLRMPNAEIFAACSHDNGHTWSEPVNITNTTTPDCEAGDCASETSMSLAARTSEGMLHFTYVRDLHAGSYDADSLTSDLFVDGSEETTNPVIYESIPVEDISWSPSEPDPHIGLVHYQRDFLFDRGHPDSMDVHEDVLIVNEHSVSVYLDEVDLLYGPEDNFWDEANHRCGWSVFIPSEGVYIPDPRCQGEWRVPIAPYSTITCRVHVGNQQLPHSDQLFRFAFSTGEERVYRFAYQDSLGNSLVERLDAENIGVHNVRMLYRTDCNDLVDLRDTTVPTELELLPAWPNPFNPVTHIPFSLSRAGDVRLEVFDLAGRCVTTLIEGRLTAGKHELLFDGSALSSGVYFSRLSAGEEVRVGKLMLIK